VEKTRLSNQGEEGEEGYPRWAERAFFLVTATILGSEEGTLDG